MQRLYRFLLSLIIILSSIVFSAVLYAEHAINPIDSGTIIFFPFTDYTDSSMKYLSGYIPELLTANFKSEKKIVPVNFSNTKYKLKNEISRIENLSDRENLLLVMKESGAGMGVTGRYLINGQTIIIETVLLKSDGSYISATPFEGKIDDRFFKTMTDFAESRTGWIRADILHENIHTDTAEHNYFISSILKILKNAGISSIGKGWFFAILIVIIFYFLSLSVSTLLIKTAEKFSLKTKSDIDNLLISIAKKPLKFIIILSGIKVALFVSDIQSAIVIFTGKFITALILIAFAYVASGVFGIFIKSWGDRIADKINPRINNDLVPLFNRAMKVLVFSVVLILILSSFDIDVAPLVASLGIAGFAIGFAVKDTLSNIIGGIILILDNSFSVGDKVTIDDDTGIVREVGIRNTKILTYDNELIIIPNGELMNKKFKNYVLPDPTQRVLVNFSVAYGSDVDRVRELILEAVKSVRDICIEPAPVIEFFQMADFSLNFNAKFWIPDFSKYNDKMLEATDVIYKTLNANGIDIPFPTNTVYLKNE